MRKVYDNVNSSRFSCMRREAGQQVRQFASQHGYTIERLQMPEGDHATWRAVLTKGASRLEVAVKVSRSNNRLALEVIKMPALIPPAAAVRKVDAIYRYCG